MTATAYCSDETIAIIDATDFLTICPDDQCLCQCGDGLIGSDGWTIASTSLNFNARGLQSGQVVRITGPNTLVGPNAPQYGIAYTSPDGQSLTLRQKGQPNFVGEPIGPAGTIGVQFRVTTLGPQIARASRDLDQRFGLENIITGQVQVALFDPTELEELTGLFVLYRQFLSLQQTGGLGYRQTTKSDMYKNEFDDRLSRAVIHWKPLYVGQPSPASTRFGCRLSR